MTVHLLRSLQDPRAVCGAYLPEQGTPNPTLVTCPRCRAAILPVSTPESSLLRQVRTAAQAYGWLTYHTFRSDRSEKGFVDLVLSRPQDAVICAELKTRVGKLTMAQQAWQDSLRQATGIECYLWRPSDLEQILERLRTK